MNLKTGVSRKRSRPNFPKNQHFLPPDTHTYVRAYQWVRNFGFSENLACFVFLKHPFWDFRPFALLPTIYLLSRIYLKRGSVLWPAQECNSLEKDLVLKITSSLVRFQGYLLNWHLKNNVINDFTNSNQSRNYCQISF